MWLTEKVNGCASDPATTPDPVVSGGLCMTADVVVARVFIFTRSRVMRMVSSSDDEDGLVNPHLALRRGVVSIPGV